MQSQRMTAAAQGEKHFDGSACKICTATKRWTINGSCVACSKAKAKIAMAKQRVILKELMEQAKAI